MDCYENSLNQLEYRARKKLTRTQCRGNQKLCYSEVDFDLENTVFRLQFFEIAFSINFEQAHKLIDKF